jgi:hypothetical protein
VTAVDIFIPTSNPQHTTCQEIPKKHKMMNHSPLWQLSRRHVLLGDCSKKIPTRRSPIGSTGGAGEGVVSGRGSALGDASS